MVAELLEAEGETLALRDPQDEDHPVAGVLVPVDQRLVDGITIRATDRTAWIAAFDLAAGSDWDDGSFWSDFSRWAADPERPEAGRWWLVEANVPQQIARVRSHRAEGGDVLYELVVQSA